MSFGVGVIKNKYGIEDHWYSKEVRTAYEASVWRNIRAHMPCFKSRISFQVGNETNISFWNNNCIGHEPLMDFLSRSILTGRKCFSFSITKQRKWDLEYQLQKEEIQ